MDGSDKKENLRVKRSRLSIKTAFFALLETTPFEKITVRMIAQQAMISQPTFYYHYHDKYELAESLMQDTLATFRLKVNEYIDAKNDRASLARLWDEFSRDRNLLNHQRELLERIYLPSVDFHVQQRTAVYDIAQKLLPAEEKHDSTYDLRRYILANLILDYITGSYWNQFPVSFEMFLTAAQQGAEDYLKAFYLPAPETAAP